MQTCSPHSPLTRFWTILPVGTSTSLCKTNVQCMYIYTSVNVKWADCNIDLLYVLTFSPIAEYNESYYVTDGALDESNEICYHDCDCENFTCYHTGELYIRPAQLRV